MSRPHENGENDVSFSMKTQTFENVLQSGKIWKHNSIGVVWTGQFTENANFWKRLVMWSQSQPTFIWKIQDGEYRQRTYCCFDWYLTPMKLGCELAVECLCSWNLNNAFYTCAVEGWKRFQSFSSFPCGRVKRYVNDRVDAILSLRFQWNKNENFWKRIRVDGA